MLQELKLKGGIDGLYDFSHSIKKREQKMGEKIIGNKIKFDADPWVDALQKFQTAKSVGQFIQPNGYLPQYSILRALIQIKTSAKHKFGNLKTMATDHNFPVIDTRLAKGATQEYFQQVVRPKMSILDSEKLAIQQLSAGIGQGRLFQLPMSRGNADEIFDTMNNAVFAQPMIDPKNKTTTTGDDYDTDQEYEDLMGDDDDLEPILRDDGPPPGPPGPGPGPPGPRKKEPEEQKEPRNNRFKSPNRREADKKPTQIGIRNQNQNQRPRNNDPVEFLTDRNATHLRASRQALPIRKDNNPDPIQWLDDLFAEASQERKKIQPKPDISKDKLAQDLLANIKKDNDQPPDQNKISHGLNIQNLNFNPIIVPKKLQEEEKKLDDTDMLEPDAGGIRVGGTKLRRSSLDDRLDKQRKKYADIDKRWGNNIPPPDPDADRIKIENMRLVDDQARKEQNERLDNNINWLVEEHQRLNDLVIQYSKTNDDDPDKDNAKIRIKMYEEELEKVKNEYIKVMDMRNQNQPEQIRAQIMEAPQRAGLQYASIAMDALQELIPEPFINPAIPPQDKQQSLKNSLHNSVSYQKLDDLVIQDQVEEQKEVPQLVQQSQLQNQSQQYQQQLYSQHQYPNQNISNFHEQPDPFYDVSMSRMSLSHVENIDRHTAAYLNQQIQEIKQQLAQTSAALNQQVQQPTKSKKEVQQIFNLNNELQQKLDNLLQNQLEVKMKIQADKIKGKQALSDLKNEQNLIRQNDINQQQVVNRQNDINVKVQEQQAASNVKHKFVKKSVEEQKEAGVRESLLSLRLISLANELQGVRVGGDRPNNRYAQVVEDDENFDMNPNNNGGGGQGGDGGNGGAGARDRSFNSMKEKIAGLVDEQLGQQEAIDEIYQQQQQEKQLQQQNNGNNQQVQQKIAASEDRVSSLIDQVGSLLEKIASYQHLIDQLQSNQQLQQQHSEQQIKHMADQLQDGLAIARQQLQESNALYNQQQQQLRELNQQLNQQNQQVQHLNQNKANIADAHNEDNQIRQELEKVKSVINQPKTHISLDELGSHVSGRLSNYGQSMHSNLFASTIFPDDSISSAGYKKPHFYSGHGQRIAGLTDIEEVMSSVSDGNGTSHDRQFKNETESTFYNRLGGLSSDTGLAQHRNPVRDETESTFYNRIGDLNSDTGLIKHRNPVSILRGPGSRAKSEHRVKIDEIKQIVQEELQQEQQYEKQEEVKEMIKPKKQIKSSSQSRIGYHQVGANGRPLVEWDINPNLQPEQQLRRNQDGIPMLPNGKPYWEVVPDPNYIDPVEKYINDRENQVKQGKLANEKFTSAERKMVAEQYHQEQEDLAQYRQKPKHVAQSFHLGNQNIINAGGSLYGTEVNREQNQNREQLNDIHNLSPGHQSAAHSSRSRAASRARGSEIGRQAVQGFNLLNANQYEMIDLDVNQPVYVKPDRAGHQRLIVGEGKGGKGGPAYGNNDDMGSSFMSDSQAAASDTLAGTGVSRYTKDPTHVSKYSIVAPSYVSNRSEKAVKPSNANMSEMGKVSPADFRFFLQTFAKQRDPVTREFLIPYNTEHTAIPLDIIEQLESVKEAWKQFRNTLPTAEKKLTSTSVPNKKYLPQVFAVMDGTYQSKGRAKARQSVKPRQSMSKKRQSKSRGRYNEESAQHSEDELERLATKKKKKQTLYPAKTDRDRSAFDPNERQNY